MLVCGRIWNAGAGHARLPSKLVFVGAPIKSSAAQLTKLQWWLGRGHVQLSPLITIIFSTLYAYLQFFFSLYARAPVERLDQWTCLTWRANLSGQA